MDLPNFPRPPRRGIYLLPNLLTTAALFCGYLAIIKAMTGYFEYAAIAIFAGMVFDGLDGRVARRTETQTEFGAQYDSLSDMVCFGVAPSLVAYVWALQHLGKGGWIAAFIYCACAALRLARFNTNIGIVDKRYFQGLPSPAAAGLVAGLVWFAISNKIEPVSALDNNTFICWAAFIVTLFAGIMMVSNIPFFSGKNINPRKGEPFLWLIALVIAFCLGAIYPPEVFFSLFLLYAFSGIVLWLCRRRGQKPANPEEDRVDPAEDDTTDETRAPDDSGEVETPDFSILPPTKPARGRRLGRRKSVTAEDPEETQINEDAAEKAAEKAAGKAAEKAAEIAAELAADIAAEDSDTDTSSDNRKSRK